MYDLSKHLVAFNIKHNSSWVSPLYELTLHETHQEFNLGHINAGTPHQRSRPLIYKRGSAIVFFWIAPSNFSLIFYFLFSLWIRHIMRKIRGTIQNPKISFSKESPTSIVNVSWYKIWHTDPAHVWKVTRENHRKRDKIKAFLKISKDSTSNCLL